MPETYTPDNLFAGSAAPKVMDKMTILAGQNLMRGAVLGRITATGKAKLVDSASADGSEKPWAVLAENVDATAAEKEAAVFLTGEFKEAALVFGGADTADTHRVEARKMGIFFRKTQLY